MTVELKPELEALIQKRLQSGALTEKARGAAWLEISQAFRGPISASCFQTAGWRTAESRKLPRYVNQRREREEGSTDQAAAPLSLQPKMLMLMSAYLPGCRADGMADVRDLKSRGDFPRVGSTPTPGTTSLGKPAK